LRRPRRSDSAEGRAYRGLPFSVTMATS
jgi:hypothetical protein